MFDPCSLGLTPDDVDLIERGSLSSEMTETICDSIRRAVYTMCYCVPRGSA